jgi:hypothetical protein
MPLSVTYESCDPRTSALLKVKGGLHLCYTFVGQEPYFESLGWRTFTFATLLLCAASVEMAEEPTTGTRRSSRQFVPVKYVRLISAMIFLVALARSRAACRCYTQLTVVMYSDMRTTGPTSLRLLGRSGLATLPHEKRLPLPAPFHSVRQAGVPLRLEALTPSQARS